MARHDRRSLGGSGRMGGVSFASVPTEKVRRKANGIHYTPPLLAAYLAEQVVDGLKDTRATYSELSILDPACGEGELLKAVVDAVPLAWKNRLRLTGFDMDEAALEHARGLLKDSGVASVELRAGDFLSGVAGVNASAQMDLLQPNTTDEEAQFDAVISNPPFVRTQDLG